MTILDKTRKLLWARSGNQCALCRHELIREPTGNDDDSIIGDECHIIAKNPNGPRGNPSIGKEYIDSYENLILLCKIHHKLVDDQPNTYTVDYLRKVKEEHERWVRSSLQANDLADEFENLDIASVIEYIKNKNRRNATCREQTQRALSMLPPRHQFVLKYRYGLFGVRKHTYAEMASLLGVYSERIRQLEKQAFRRLNEL